MKILFDASAVFSKNKGGGIYNCLINLLPALAKIAKKNGDEFLYFNFFFRYRPIYPPDLEIEKTKVINFRMPVRFLNTLWIKLSFPDLSWFLKDVNIFHSPHFTLPVISKAKKILTVHDITYLKYPDYYDAKGKILNEYGYRKLLPVNLLRADKIIAISQNTKKDIIDYFNIPEDKIEVVYNGCNIPEPIPEEKRKKILDSFKLLENKYIYFPAGTFEPRKNIQNTIKAFKKIIPKNSKIQLVISGVGNIDWLQKDLINDRIVFLNWKTPEEKNTLYQAAIFILYPSLYEGFGIPALEALANRKALITSNSSSLPEIANGYAHLVNPSNISEIEQSIELFLKDEKLRKKFESKSTERAKCFSCEKMAEDTYHIYKKLIKS